MTLTHLVRVFVLRDMLAHPARAVLAVLGVAAGVAVVCAVQAAGTAAVASFASNVEALSGGADIRITANGLPLDENIMEQVPWLWDHGSMTPSLLGRVSLDDKRRPSNPEQLLVVGLDLLATPALERDLVRDPSKAAAIDEFLAWLISEDSVLVPAGLANEMALSDGSSIQVSAPSGTRTLRVAGRLTGEGVSSAFGGDLLIMDIAAAQVLLGRSGSLDRVDIFLNDPAERSVVVDRLRSELPDTVVVDVPDREAAQNERMLRAFRLNIGALSATSLIVGVVAVYSVLSATVVRRRKEIATLRCLGTPRTTVVGLFCFQALLLGALGAVLGVVGGSALAQVGSLLVTKTIADFYSGMSLTPDLALLPRVEDAGLALALGVVLSAASGMFPAWRAGRIPPAQGLRDGFSHTDQAFPRRRTVLGIALLIIGVVCAFGPPMRGLPILGYLAAALAIGSAGLLMPSLLNTLLTAGLRRVTNLNTRLAIQSVIHARHRCSAAATAFAVAVAMIVSVGTMVASFRETVKVWIGETLRADIYIRPEALAPGEWSSFVPESALAVLNAVTGVDQLDLFRGLRLEYNGTPVVLGASDFRTLGDRRRLLFTNGEDSARVLERIAGQDRVLVSEPFSLRQGVRNGNVIILPTPSGPGRFRIENIFFDYSNDRGVILMDRSTYRHWYQDTRVSSVAVYLDPGVNPESVQKEIAQRLEQSKLHIVANRELREQVLQVFDQTFRITYALEGIAVFCALLGISNSLASFVLDRRAEMAMLRFVGAEPRWIQRLVVSEAGALTAVAIVVGAVLGALLSGLLIWVINRQSFGWTIQLSVPVAFLGLSMIVLVIAGLGSGLYPAWLVLKQDPLQSVRNE